MKRLGILALFIALAGATITEYGPYNMPSQNMWRVDTIIAAESTAVIYRMGTSDITGAFAFQYMVRAIDGSVKVTLYFSESNDYDYGWYNATKIDSCVAADSALDTIAPHPSSFLKISTNGFMAAGDSAFVWWKVNAERK